jgi:DMSO/TMAO reductase YedYZ molybdopterin-dependent catalytic subunit
MAKFLRSCQATIFLLIASLCLQAFGQSPASKPSAPDARITIGGEVDQPRSVTANDLAKLPRRTIQAKDHDGNLAKYEGVALYEVLNLAGVTFGDLLKGRNLTKYLLVEAADHYQVIFALPELDPAYTDKIVLLADRRDGKPLAEKEGPFRLVVPDEKRQTRWLRQVAALTIYRANEQATTSGVKQ